MADLQTELTTLMGFKGLPIGSIIMWPNPVMPDPLVYGEWGECNGTVFNPVTYPELEVALTSTGFATGQLPNLNGMFPRARDHSGTNIDPDGLRIPGNQ